MSRKTFSQALSSARTSARAAAAAAEAKHPAIATARIHIANCEAVLETARQNVNLSESALNSANKAARATDLPAVKVAADAAQRRLTGVREAHAKATQTLELARSVLPAVLEPVQAFINVCADIDRIGSSSPNGNYAGMAYSVRTQSRAIVAQLEAANTEVGAASRKFSSANVEHDRAVEHEKAIGISLSHMESAQSASPSDEGAQAVAELKAAHLTAKSAVLQAGRQHSRAEQELRLALEKDQVLQLSQTLVGGLDDLVYGAQEEDSQYRGRKAREEESRRESERRAADPCTCSETNCPCSYCSMQQQRRAGGHDRERSISD